MKTRTHCVSTRFDPEELAALDRWRGRMRRGQFVRHCLFSTAKPVVVPEVNRTAWAELARVAGNLNQLARHLNTGGAAEVREVLAEVQAVRQKLIGLDLREEGDE